MAGDRGPQRSAAAGAAVLTRRPKAGLLVLQLLATTFLAGMLVASRALPAHAATPAPDNGYSSLLINADGHLETFARAQNGVIFHSWQEVFGTWYRLAGPTAMQGTPMAGLNADGRGEAFAIASDGVLMHTWQPAWPSWTPVSAQPGLSFVGQPAVSRNADGRLEVFARSAGGTFYHSWQEVAGGGWSGWNSVNFGVGIFSSDPVVIQNADGRQEIFGVAAADPVWDILGISPAPDGTVIHQWQETPNGNWSGYSSLGGQSQAKVAAVRNSDGRLEIFALDIFGSLGHIWQQTAGGAWSSGWGGLGGSSVGNPAVIVNPDGRLEVFTRGQDGQTYHWWQSSNTAWDGFGWLFGLATGDPIVTAEPSQVISLWVPQSTRWFENDRTTATVWSNWMDRGGPPGG